MVVVLNAPVRLFSEVVKSAAVRTGVSVGVGLSLVFTAWLLLASRIPVLEPSALPRSFIAASLLGLVACLPLVRFFRSPWELLLSSLLAWGLFTLMYAGLCLEFVTLDPYYSTAQFFVLGAVVYLLLATLSWIYTIIWRVRAAHSSPPHR